MAEQALSEDSLVGHALGHYRLDERIGQGGMGVVYRAHDEHLDRDVAIKILPTELLASETARHCFHKEAHALSKLNHPNIATVYDFDSCDDIDYLAEELIPGMSLDEMLAAGPLSEKECIDLGMQLCAGLATAHEHGIIHRDIKPGNIRVTPEGHLKILDFGLAKTVPTPMALADERLTLSETQSVVGTFPYMSPEQLTNKKLDAHTDIWAVGTVLYEMATGRRPFPGSGATLSDAILHGSPNTPSKINHKLSPGFDAIVQKCLEKEPSLRYQSAREIAVDLKRLGAPSPAVQAAAKKRGRLWILASASLLILIGTAVTLFWRTRQSKALTEKDTVVLADFDNNTEDAVFNDALKQGLAVELGQSPFLNVLSEQKVAETLGMMGRPANERITTELGRELCLRTGSKALLVGAISRLGNHYLIVITATACSTGDSLAKEQSEATHKEDVLNALSRASSKLRVRLGESLPSVQKFDVPLEATTSSLEALRNYSMGVRIKHEKGLAPSIPFMKRAIELDPNFPLAYSELAITYVDLQQPSLALEYATKAYELRDRVTERERLIICALYFNAMGDLEKEAQTYELWTASYPRNPAPYANLGGNYAIMGQYDKALPKFQQALRLAPDNVVNYSNLAVIYLNLNRLDEADAVLAQALTRKLDDGGLRAYMYLLAFLRGDVAHMEQQVAWATGKPGDEDLLLSMQSDTEAYNGLLRRARDFSDRAVNSALRAESRETAALWQANAGLREAELGNAESARKRVTAALALSTGRDVKIAAALALASIGDTARAQALAEKLEKDYSTHTMLKLYWLPTIKATIELKKGNSSRALAYLQSTSPYELGQAGMFINFLYPVYVRGQSYLAARNGTAAVAEFRKMLDHRGIVQNFITGQIARLQIGRAYCMSGETAKAKAAYEDFFSLWKQADPDIPIYQQAKAEYAKLQ